MGAERAETMRVADVEIVDVHVAHQTSVTRAATTAVSNSK